MESISSDYCTGHYNVKIWSFFDLELQLINTRPLIKNELKELLREFKV